MTTPLLDISGFVVGPNPQFDKLGDHFSTACQDGADDVLLRNRTQSKPGGDRNEMNTVQQGHGSGFNNFQANAQNVNLEPVAPLQVSANRWDRKAMQIDPDSPEIMDRKVTALLNKLTTEKFDSISNQIITWANKSEKEKDGRTLVQVIRLVFEHAIDGATWSEMYARLCRKMMEQISPKLQDDGIKNSRGKPIAGGRLFLQYLLKRCQEDFERGRVVNEATAAAAVKASEDEAAKAANQQSKEGGTEEVASYSGEYCAAQKAKRQGLGLMKFIGELFKLRMLTERVMHEYVKKLLGNLENPEEEEIESLCTLLTTVGASLDRPKARAHMDVYFSRMKELIKSQNVSSRMQFMLLDIIELRERKWISHNAVAAQMGPDGWVVRPSPKVGDFSNFGKISKAQPMTFGPGKKGTEIKRESISRTSSSSNMFSMLSQNTEAGADTTAKVAAEPVQRKRLVLQPWFKPVEDAEAAPSNVESKDNSSVDVASPEMTDEDAKKKIAEDSEEFFSVRNLDEAEVYFSALPSQYHHNLVDKLVSTAVESKEADAQLVADFFSRAASKELCSPAAFEEGFARVKAFQLFVMMMKGADFDHERRSRVASKLFGELFPQDKESYNRQIRMSRGGDRGEFEQVGPDGWAVAGSSSGAPRPPPKVGDLPDFGKISKAQPMEFGPCRVFAGKTGTENKQESISRKSSSSNMFSMLSQNSEAGADTTAKAAAESVQRNSLAAISRLPPKIFVCCAAACEPGKLAMDWVKVTHVSRHWRKVAIGCPRLWTALVFAQPRWVEEMLKRSKMAPLVIDAQFGSSMGSKTTKAVQLAMNHISRVRELSIVSHRASFGKLFSSVPRAAPMLQILVLSTSINHYADPFRDNYSIPLELFSDDSSQLRRLELTHSNLDWTSHLLKGLTHLKVHNTALGTRPSMHLFLDVLDQLPTLTVLDLDDALPHVADGSSTVPYQRNVKLLSLTNLRLAGSYSDCSNVLRHLSVPSSATLKLYCQSTVVSDADLSSILTFVSGLWEPTPIVSSAAKPHKCPIRSLKIQCVGSVSVGLQAWPTMLSFQTLSGNLDPLPSIDLIFQWPPTLGIGDKVFGETCAALPLEQLASLDIFSHLMSEMTEQTLLRTFGKLAHLRSIRAQGLATYTLLSAMIAEPSIPATSPNVSANLSMLKRSRNRREMPLPVYFPSLLHLTIENRHFDYAKLKALKDCLMERQERKAEVRKLALSRCRGLTTELVDELREIVADVIWDGREIDVSDDDDYGYDSYDPVLNGSDPDDDYYRRILD